MPTSKLAEMNVKRWCRTTVIYCFTVKTMSQLFCEKVKKDKIVKKEDGEFFL